MRARFARIMWRSECCAYSVLVYPMVGTALAGGAVVVVLTLGRVDLASILGAAAVGAVAALPVSWLVARKLSQD